MTDLVGCPKVSLRGAWHGDGPLDVALQAQVRTTAAKVLYRFVGQGASRRLDEQRHVMLRLPRLEGHELSADSWRTSMHASLQWAVPSAPMPTAVNIAPTLTRRAPRGGL